MKESNINIYKSRFSFTFAVATTFNIVYIIKYHLHYPFYNIFNFMVPVSCFLLFFGFFIRKSKKHYLPLTFTYCLIHSFLYVHLINMAGGYNASSISWLIALVIYPVAVLGNFGILTGLITFIAANIMFYITDPGHREIYNYLLENNLINKERIINQSLFSICSITCIYFVLYLNERKEYLLKKGNQQIDNLLKIVIHDISNPIFIIKNKITKLKRLDNLKNNKDFAIVDNALENLTEQLDSVREMRALQAGKHLLKKQKVDIILLINEVIDNFELQAEEKNIKIILESNLKSIFLDVDPVVFKNQIIANLLSNAIKFSFHNSKIIIEVNMSDNEHLSIHIKDNGIGIPNDLIDNLFKIDKKTNRKGTDGEKGTGFGLPLVKDYVKELSGEISVSSKEHSIASKNRPDDTTKCHQTVFTIEFDKVAC